MGKHGAAGPVTRREKKEPCGMRLVGSCGRVPRLRRACCLRHARAPFGGSTHRRTGRVRRDVAGPTRARFSSGRGPPPKRRGRGREADWKERHAHARACGARTGLTKGSMACKNSWRGQSDINHSQPPLHMQEFNGPVQQEQARRVSPPSKPLSLSPRSNDRTCVGCSCSRRPSSSELYECALIGASAVRILLPNGCLRSSSALSLSLAPPGATHWRERTTIVAADTQRDRPSRGCGE